MEGFGQAKRDRLYSPKGIVVLFQLLDKADSLLWYVRKLYESQFDRLEWMCVVGWWEETYQVDPVHDTDAEGHEGFGEVDDLFTLCCDGEACDCQVSFLKQNESAYEYTVKRILNIAMRT